MTDQDIVVLMEDLGKAKPGGSPELIETHISWVILMGDRAWKIKKPMHYAFLDFRTLESREEYCRRELELNRRQAPDMYLGLVRVCREDGQMSISAECEGGETLDFAVEMKRMTEAHRLDRLMDAGKVAAESGAVLAKQVAVFHRQAPIIRNPARSSIEQCASDFMDLGSVVHDFARHLGQDASQQLLLVIAESMDWLRGKEELLARRLDEGWVRDLHGDLHTRNVFVEEKGYVVFDCIEFNDAFRQIDVLSEIAFLYMDVEVRGMKAFGDAFLEAYLREVPAVTSAEEWELFNYFRRYRANVRAKVNALRARQATGEELEKAVAEMRLYLDLMEKTAIVTP